MEKNKNKYMEMPAASEQAADVAHQPEDAAMKTVMQFFADELLPYLGIKGEVIRIAPTELVYLEVKKLFEDFNLEMKDGSWLHFEFQSSNEGLKSLKRFRTYEALTSYLHDVSVTTYVLYSGNIRHPMTKFREGLNTYRVRPITMKSKNADKVLEKLEKKIKSGRHVTKSDLIPLILTPLMDGQSSLMERFRAAFCTIKQCKSLTSKETQKMEAVVYAMAEKFLDEFDLNQLRKEIRMTRIGKMMLEEGENRVSQLIQQLIQANRMDDIRKATSDKKYREKLYKEFHL